MVEVKEVKNLVFVLVCLRLIRIKTITRPRCIKSRLVCLEGRGGGVNECVGM